nr:integrase, catalytic region, zinc finger, CCHC-type, peptidase aspartic, catalytic [Tanacetum cinerariifolium]
MIKKVYYVKGLNHNLFSVGQFCDADIEVAFRKSTCFIRDLHGNNLLTGTRGSDFYTIELQESSSLTPICVVAKALPSQAWLWHRRLSHLNFDTINMLSKNDIVKGLTKLKFVKDHLCSSYEMGKEKKSSFKSLTITRSKKRLDLLYMDLCGPMRIETINGKKYILVIVDDYSRYTWNLFLRSKDETPEEEGNYFKESFGFSLAWKLFGFSILHTGLLVIKKKSTNKESSIWIEASSDRLDFRSTNQAKYTLEILKKHAMDKYDSIGTPMATKPKLDADLSALPIDQTKYRSMIGSLMCLTSSRPNLVQAIKDYGIDYNKIPLYYESQSAIVISCNPVQHSRTKHINVRYHFIKELVKHGIVELYFVRTEYQLADMFTKALSQDRFEYLVRRLGMRCLTLAELEVVANETA